MILNYQFKLFSMKICLLYFCFNENSEAENGDVWYYTTAQQFEKLLEVLDAAEMEAPLVRELLEMKQEILRQMDVTEKLTNQAKGNRKSYLEVENANIIKLRKVQEEQNKVDQEAEFKIGVKDESEITLVTDGDVVNEVTITSDETIKDENDDIEDEDPKKIKNNCTPKLKSLIQKKNDDSELTFNTVLQIHIT